jgi:hypothetical protein
MDFDNLMPDIIDALRQNVIENYLSEYNIDQDRLEQIKAIKEPVMKRLAINLNKYCKAISAGKTCLICGKTASMCGFTWFSDGRQGNVLWVAYFVCEHHYKKLFSGDSKNLLDRIKVIIASNNYDVPSKSIIHSRKQYNDVEELPFSLINDDLKLFAEAKHWNGYMIGDYIAKRILYSNNKLSLLKFYTGFDEFGTSFRYVEHSPKEKVSFESPGYWTIDNLFASDDYGLLNYLNPLFTRDKIEEAYWEWVVEDINQRNGNFIDLKDKKNFNRFVKRRSN